MFYKSCLKVWDLLLVLVLVSASSAIAQDNHSEERAVKPSSAPSLKIGLVLSGGGARGVAHIGVLQWLEEHRIPVNYVTGTSIGGLIGGVYSMGMSPAEARQLLNSLKWDEIFSTGPSYQQLGPRRKEDRRAFQSGIELGLRQGVNFPPGLSTNHYIGLVLDHLTLAYSGIKNFDELPIPYRCVATDFLKGEQVIFKDGALATAMRATMSMPAVFRPVEYDGKVLVDGTLLNNIPTDVMKEFGPDVIIAVDVGTTLGDLKSVISLTGVLTQSMTVMLVENDRRNLRLADVIIAPELGAKSILDFSGIDKLIDAGYQAAEQKAGLLQKLALDEAQWQEYLARRNAKRRTSVPVPDALEIAGVSTGARKELKEELIGYVGHPLEPKKLEADLTRITGQGRYESLQYAVFPDRPEPGLNLLLVEVNQKRYAPPTLNLGVEIDGSDVNEINFTVGARMTLYDVGKHGAEWRSDIKLGFGNIFASEYFLPLGRGFFIAPQASYRRERRDFFAGDHRVAQYQTERYGTGFDVGYLNHRSELRLGYEVGHLDANVRSGDPKVLSSANGMVSVARVRWTFDGQDSATIPTNGVRFITEGRWFFQTPDAPGSFGQVEMKLSAFRPVSKRGSAFLIGSGGTSFEQKYLGTQQFGLGGPFRLGAYNRDEFRGDRYLLASLGYLHKLSQLPPFWGGKVYAGGWYDFGGAYGGINANTPGNRFRNALSAGFIVDTILGPFSVVGSWGEGGRGKIYFAVGKFF